MPLYVRYIKYANPKNDMNERLFLQVLQELSYSVQTQHFPQDIVDVLQQELNGYYITYFGGLQGFEEQDKADII